MVPSYNEGSALIDTIETLFSQDYLGPIRIQVLVEDERDTSVVPLREHFDLGSSLTTDRGNRTLAVQLSGLRRKNDKINWALDRTTTPLIAFLDADHRADPRWISSSVATLKRTGAAACQSVRGPLDARRLFQFWDSAENHLGNEVLNRVTAALGMNSFFTGTTCIFRADVLLNQRFPESITEDTYLSFQLLVRGKRIAFNAQHGSYEEVAPDLGTYIARRRRWSCGHNQTFFHHLTAIFRSRVSLAKKLQLLMHGAYFTLPSLIVSLVLAVGLFTYFQLTDNVQRLVVLISLFLSGALSFATSSVWKDRAINLVLAFCWIFGQVALLGPFFYRTSGDSLYFQLAEFPYAQKFLWLQAALILLPLAVLTLGSLRIGRPAFGFLLLYLPTFPVVLFLDIYAGFVGLVDFLFGRTVWGTIRRGNSIEVSLLPESVAVQLRTGIQSRTRYFNLLLLPVGAGLLVLANDFLAFENCGNPRYLLNRPLFFEQENFDPELEVRIRKERLRKEGKFRLRVQVLVRSESGRSMRLSHSINGGATEWHEVHNGNKTIETIADLPLAFEIGTLEVGLQGDGAMCRVQRKFSAVLSEIRNGLLHVNGEPFVIKGVVPSFRNAQIDLSVHQGLEQIRQIGANTIRLYHTPTAEIQDAAQKLDLMLVSQPNESTWQNLDMADSGADEELVRRYDDLVQSTSGHPQILIDNLGNELELTHERVRATRNIASALKKARRGSNYRFPLSYSTYGLFFDYRVDIFAVNMLDTGRVYWRDGVALAKEKHRAYYASEFGGFVAFHETVNPLVRAARVSDNWNTLIETGASGGVFFQSHDNWAQPIVEGYNDPFRPEQADDTRGLWDHRNQPKLVHEHLRRLYSDVELSWVENQDIGASAKTVLVTNRRPYVLEDIQVTEFGSLLATGRLAPGDSLRFPVPTTRGLHEFDFRYTTHHGLESSYPVEIVDPYSVAEPRVLTKLTRVIEKTPTSIELQIYRDNQLQFALPASWTEYSVNGEARPHTGGLLSYTLPEPSVAACGNVEISQSPHVWFPLPDNHIDSGYHYVRCRVPEVNDIASYTLVLEGTAASHVEFVGPREQIVGAGTHSYRENRISMRRAMGAINDGVLTYRLDRTGIPYIDGVYTPDRKPIHVPMSPPRFEKIQTVSIHKLE